MFSGKRKKGSGRCAQRSADWDGKRWVATPYYSGPILPAESWHDDHRSSAGYNLPCPRRHDRRKRLATWLLFRAFLHYVILPYGPCGDLEVRCAKPAANPTAGPCAHLYALPAGLVAGPAPLAGSAPRAPGGAQRHGPTACWGGSRAHRVRQMPHAASREVCVPRPVEWQPFPLAEQPPPMMIPAPLALNILSPTTAEASY